MPIFSYLAYPEQGAKRNLFESLKQLKNCQVMPSGNEELLILVTDTPDDESEEELQKKLNQINTLQCLSMTFGYVDEKTKEFNKR